MQKPKINIKQFEKIISRLEAYDFSVYHKTFEHFELTEYQKEHFRKYYLKIKNKYNATRINTINNRHSYPL